MRNLLLGPVVAGLVSTVSTLMGCGGATDLGSFEPPPLAPGADGGQAAGDMVGPSQAPRAPERPDSAVASLDSAASAPATSDAGVDAGPAPDAAPSLRCQADEDRPQGTDYASPGPHTTGTLEITWEDSTRPIVATAKHGAAPSRRLVTTVYYPASGPAPLFGQAPLAKGGPFPLLMYSHGYSSNREEARAIATRASTHGYIVVAPDFPLTSLLSNGGSPDVNDAASQPGDVSFLIDKVLSLSADAKHPLAGSVDKERIGALGVSLGGLTTLLVSFHPKLRDPRIKAAAPIAPLAYFFAEEFYHTRALPTLFVHGDLDAFIDYQANARRGFMRAAPHARLLTVKKGTHAAFAFPLDSSGFGGLLNALLARPDAHPSNPDGLGCGAVGDTLAATGVEFLEALADGAEQLIVTTEEEAMRLLPCKNGEYKMAAIDAKEQQELATRSVLAFFEAQLGSSAETRQDGCRYLLHEVVKNPAVTLE